MNNPWLAQYANDPWMMEPKALEVWLRSLSGRDVGRSLSALMVEYKLPMKVQGDTAVIRISGVLLKNVPGWLRLYGYDVTGYDEVARMLQTALDDATVSRIELRITSPGGQVAGGMEAAAAIRAADTVKPVTAVIEDLGASGAYWLATSARRIEANANAEVGSIGVYMVYYDASKLADDEGVKVIVIRSGEHKGMGVFGAPITETQVAAMQEVIDGMNGHFIEQVSRGRQVTREKAAEWATGRVWLAPAAKTLGLIDALTTTASAAQNAKEISMEQTQSQQVSAAPAGASTSSAAAEQPTPSVADAQATEKSRIDQITAAFKADPAFAIEAISNGWSVTEAKAIRHDRLEAAQAASADGEQAIPFGESTTGEGKTDFMAEAKRIAREEKISMTEAMRRVRQEDPDCYERFLAKEANRAVRVHGGKAAGRVTR